MRSLLLLCLTRLHEARLHEQMALQMKSENAEYIDQVQNNTRYSCRVALIHITHEALQMKSENTSERRFPLAE